MHPAAFVLQYVLASFSFDLSMTAAGDDEWRRRRAIGRE
jgi:hypothetical protein